MTTYGNLKTSSLTLQGNGATNSNVRVEVDDDRYKIGMGSSNLLSVTKSGDLIIGNLTLTHSQIQRLITY
jgi:hypothetical protein